MSEIIDRLKILDRLSDYCKELTTCGYQEVLSLAIDQIGLVNDSDPISQRMSFAVSRFERSLSLPIVGNEDHREHGVSAVLTAFPELRHNKRVQLILTRMEMLAIKLTILPGTPHAVLAASMNDKVSRVALASLNAYHVLKSLLDEVTTISDKVLQLNEE